MAFDRREFLRRGAGATLGVVLADLVGVPGCGPGDGGGFSGRGVVHVAVTQELTGLVDLGREGARAVGIAGDALLGATVFIKPNFVALGMEMFGCGYDPSTGEVTKPEVVVGVAEACLEAGAARVTIGEGAQAHTWDWSSVVFLPGNAYEGATDLKAAVDVLKARYGDNRVSLLCLNEADDWVAIPSSSTDDNVKDGMFVARSFAAADHVISVPVLKTHQWALMSGSMKNLFGTASLTRHGNGIARCKLHVAYAEVTAHGVAAAGVSGSFIDMVKWRQDQGFQDFAIIDASIGLEGDGPHRAPVNDGRTMHFRDRNTAGRYFVLASADLVAADATVARIIGVDPNEVKALQMARNLDLGEIDAVELRGAKLADLVVGDWKRPVIRSEDYFKGFC